MNSAIQEAINQQINLEFSSAYAYLAMSAHFEASGLPGCANWMRQQAQEEVSHAMRLFDFMHDRNTPVALQAIEAPRRDFGSPREVFENALHHEQKVTQSIHNLYTLATENHDYATRVMLEWFINEQVEEEKTVQGILDEFGLVGDNKVALFMIDKELGARQAEAAGGTVE